MEKVVIRTEYITLGQLIKFLSLVGSGGEVKMFLQMVDIQLNGEDENRRGKKVYPGDVVTIDSVKYQIISNDN